MAKTTLSAIIGEGMDLGELWNVINHPKSHKKRDAMLAQYIWFLSDKSGCSVHHVCSYYAVCEDLARGLSREPIVGDVVMLLPRDELRDHVRSYTQLIFEANMLAEKYDSEAPGPCPLSILYSAYGDDWYDRSSFGDSTLQKLLDGISLGYEYHRTDAMRRAKF